MAKVVPSPIRRKAEPVKAAQWQPGLLVDGVATANALAQTGTMVTLAGTFTVNPGDWVLTAASGEVWLCPGVVFEALYEIAG